MKRSLTLLFTSAAVLTASFISMPSSNAKVAQKVTFSKDVAPIFNKSCTECHRPGEAAPFSTLTYAEVRPWAKSIKEKIVNRVMPPWHADPHFGQFANDRKLTDKEIATIVAWVDGGAVEGNPKDMPKAPTFVKGWNIPQPDVVFPITEEYTYKPGADEYQYFDVPTNFTEDKYIQYAEARPTNAKIVHHILAFIVPPGTPNMGKMTPEQRYKAMEMMLKNSPFYRDGYLMRMKPDQPVIDDACAPVAGGGRQRGGGTGDILTGFAPGHNADIWEPGVGKMVPAGSTIRFQIHYSNQTVKTSEVEKDRSMIGLVFAKEQPKRLLVTNSVGNMNFKIPAGAENHKVTGCRTFNRDVTLYAYEPHMHYRGKSMEYKAIYPDGKEEILISVPKWDFGWQTNYVLKQPKRLPAGTRLQVTAYFDNSTKNKFNPDPTKDIRYGEPTYDEMMHGFMDYVTEQPVIAQVDTKILDQYVGKYEMRPGVVATITRDGNSLVVSIPTRPSMVYLPSSATKFFSKVGNSDLSFEKNNGAIEAINDDQRAKKIKDAVASN